MKVKLNYSKWWIVLITILFTCYTLFIVYSLIDPFNTIWRLFVCYCDFGVKNTLIIYMLMWYVYGIFCAALFFPNNKRINDV